MRRILVYGLFMVLASATTASAQLPIQISVSGGLAVPIGNESDVYDNGFHAGVGVKLPLIPVQLEGGFDRLKALGTNEDLSVVSGGISVPIGITPPLLPVGVYAIVGGGVYHHKAETSATDFGVNGGIGVRVGLPGVFRLFAEGRGVAVLDEVSRRTYVTASVGIRF